MQYPNIQAYACHKQGEQLCPFTYTARKLRKSDVAIKVLYTGVCHSDIHQTQNDWGNSQFPMVPGHEIVGEVIALGEGTKKYQVGDTVAVGVMVDSCLECTKCRLGAEQLCPNGKVDTYNSNDRIDGKPTFGGYATHIVVREEFVLSVPKSLDPSRVAPLLCAGITTYAPLRKWNAGPGTRVAVTGLGGLGHMALKLASGLGCEVAVISRKNDKKELAFELGADKYIAMSDPKGMKAAQSQFDLIIDTVPRKHDLKQYIDLLDSDGVLAIVGHIGPVDAMSTAPLVFEQKTLTGSCIGGLDLTQEMLDLCGRKNILPECEIITINEINDAYKRLGEGDVKFRFVIDNSKSDYAS